MEIYTPIYVFTEKNDKLSINLAVDDRDRDIKDWRINVRIMGNDLTFVCLLLRNITQLYDLLTSLKREVELLEKSS